MLYSRESISDVALLTKMFSGPNAKLSAFGTGTESKFHRKDTKAKTEFHNKVTKAAKIRDINFLFVAVRLSSGRSLCGLAVKIILSGQNRNALVVLQRKRIPRCVTNFLIVG